MSRTFRIATRQSKMAMFQTNLAIKLLQKAAPEYTFEAVPMTSDGCYERFKGDLKTIGGKGAFVKALELAMLAREADIAMHSFKDVPTDEDLPEGLIIPCTLEREDPRDAVVCREGESLAALPNGAKIGTSSVRRASQIKQAMPHLNVVPLRGNADTRVAKVDSKEVDAAVLAYAGLCRIDLKHRVTDVFEPDIMMPAVSQGAVCLECRDNDQEALEVLSRINHQPTFTVTTAERSMLTALGGSCHTPIAGWCTYQGDTELQLTGMVASLDGNRIIRATHNGTADNPAALGEVVAQDLLTQGAREILDACEAAA
ncbi:MAG: hydroxymethylbilane synthase [Alphaproteobacteria bacterium]|nr:hydroxymethylbilane synthase [Alphaproteobacteria bacterium]MDD9919249.1 hydroxymethylbilane synthase [Alphaproteobacteria bacterium]